jgi:ribosomal protein S27E
VRKLVSGRAIGKKTAALLGLSMFHTIPEVEARVESIVWGYECPKCGHYQETTAIPSVFAVRGNCGACGATLCVTMMSKDKPR